jgi:hypothetical protein
MWNQCRFFYIEGIMHKEFVPPGQTVKGKLYCDVLRRLRENIRRKLPDKCHKNSWVLHHDIAPAHASFVVQQFLASTNKTVIPRHPYSPELALLWFFFLFPNMKLKLKCRRFDSIKEIQTVSQNAMKTLTRNDFQKYFRSWKSRWNRCINAKGDYLEGDGDEWIFR